MANDNNSKIEAFRENWNHYRHVENERLFFTQIYGAIIAAVIAISNFNLEDPPLFLVIILYFGGLLGYAINLKLTYETMNHYKKK